MTPARIRLTTLSPGAWRAMRKTSTIVARLKAKAESVTMREEAPSKIANAAPNAAPDEAPSTSGDAMGF